MGPMPTRLLVIRHGESTWNALRRWQGWADPPLSPVGEAQARAAAAALAALGAGRATIATSDLRRARRTAELIAAGAGHGPGALVVDAGLRERDIGAWSGLTTAEIEARWPGMIAAWRRGEVPSPPGGEDEPTFRSRVVAACHRLAALADGTAYVLVVSHGGVIRTLERVAGVDAVVRPNLSGRWFALADGRLVAGELVSLVAGAPAGP
jgi:probable phosphoglycerate mutase